MRKINVFVASWGIGGVVVLVVFAICRLTPHAIEAFSHEISILQYLVLLVWSFYMLYSEGIIAFGKHFSPRAVARAQYLYNQKNINIKNIILAPLFCMGYYKTSRRRKVVTYTLTVGIICLIILIHFIPQPWRGIIDFGVVIGLSCGLVTLLYNLLNVLKNFKKIVTDPEVV